MDMDIMFDQFPVLESEELILGKIEEKHLQDLFRLYDNDKVFEYCGIIPKHNIQTVTRDKLSQRDYWWFNNISSNGVYPSSKPDDSIT